MNGFDSGGHAGAESIPRKTTEELPALDVRELKRSGSISPGQEQIEGVAYLQWTPCNFGGSRPWFVCPGEGCAWRVAILYGPQLLCRHCHDLRYASQRDDELARAKRRMIKAREHLPPDGTTKPKRMRHATFERLLQEYLESRRAYNALYRKWLAWASQW